MNAGGEAHTVRERRDYMRPAPSLQAIFDMSLPSSLYPSTSVLSTWSDRDWRRADGVQIETLEHMQRVIVRTYQNVYEIFVRSGSTGEVLVRGGRFFQEFTEAHLSGASLGGGFLKQLGIYVGLRLEFNVGGETILTSPIFSISISPLSLSASA
jgi:hypothetical protein